MDITSPFFHYLKQHQSTAIRHLHLTVMMLVLLEVLLSNIMHVNKQGEIGQSTLEYVGTWAHIVVGISLVFFGSLFIIVAFKQRGFKYYFPYLCNQWQPLKSDIKLLTQLTLPESKPCGISSCIQGLGLGALCLVYITGISWFISWNLNLTLAPNLLHWHKTLTGLVEAYLVGHGVMAIVHIYNPLKLKREVIN